MIEFVEECRQEWKRLRVPDPIANEMAADLEADLIEAEAEGASAEEVLGSGVFDPRSFAASWAAARGVVQQAPVTPEQAPVAAEWPPVTDERPPRRWSILVAVAVSAFVVFVGAVLLAHPGAVVVTQHDAASQPFFVSPSAPSLPPAARIHIASGIPPSMTLGMILLIVGLAAFIVSALYWSPWARARLTGRRPYSTTANGQSTR